MILPVAAGCTRSAPRTWVAGWEETAPAQVNRSAAKAVVVGDYLYVIGGVKATYNIALDVVEFARIHEDGTLGPWELTTPLHTPRMFLAASKNGHTIYALGGQTFSEGKRRLLESVERAVAGPDGTLGPWIETSPMRTPRRSATSTIVNHYLYGIGGYNGTFLKTLERAPIRDDGSLGPWEGVPQPMEKAHYIHGGATRDGRIYVVGGHIKGVGMGGSSTEWTTVGADGNLTEWHSGPSLIQPRFLAGATASENFLFVVGGYNGGYLSSVEEARILPDGRLGDWVQAAPLPSPREGAAVAVHDDTLYAIGGSRDGHYLSVVEYTRIGPDGSLGHWQTQPAGKPD